MATQILATIQQTCPSAGKKWAVLVEELNPPVMVSTLLDLHLSLLHQRAVAALEPTMFSMSLLYEYFAPQGPAIERRE
jgi:hypothetical protein